MKKTQMIGLITNGKQYVFTRKLRETDYIYLYKKRRKSCPARRREVVKGRHLHINRLEEDHMTEKYMMALYLKRLTIYEIKKQRRKNHRRVLKQVWEAERD